MNAQLQSLPTPTPQVLAETLARLKAARLNQPPPSYAQRRDDLKRLRALFQSRLAAMDAAIQADFGNRSRHESTVSDGWTVLKSIDFLLSHLRSFMRPQPRSAGWLMFPARAEVRPMPLGVVGIMAPWNYPVNLCLLPLVGAIAAGNSAYVKPSEHTPRTSAFLADLLRDAFPPEQVAVALGGPEVAAAFAALPFDHLVFTGSTAVGRKVMAAAAPNLTPLTLELGGKSPTIVGDNYPIELAAARIATGKLFNGGQTCIAPDHVFVPRAKRDAFVAALRADVARRFAEGTDYRDYTRIINAAQYRRLRSYVDDALARGLTVLPLFTVDAAKAEAERLFAPVVVLEPGADSKVMQEEIFGPILPVFGYDHIDEVIAHVNAHDRPLALYVFDHDRRRVDYVLSRCIAGGVTVNDTLLQFAAADLPFGGIGASGYGHIHGRESFFTLSKMVPIVFQSRFTGFDVLLRPPYKGLTDALVKFLSR
jgi:coniferyl-aldehyde dehydrogenase